MEHSPDLPNFLEPNGAVLPRRLAAAPLQHLDRPLGRTPPIVMPSVVTSRAAIGEERTPGGIGTVDGPASGGGKWAGGDANMTA